MLSVPLGFLLAAAPAIDFQRQIRPILSDACFQCHGPDANTRMADLRLDLKDDAFAARKSGAAVVPGKPTASQLYLRLADPSAARRMPPTHSNKKVTEAQRDLIRRWIEQGADWKEHWAFAPPVRRAGTIDSFVRARLRTAGLAPAAPADRRTLARRVALDLTGLPPDPADVEAFVTDKSANAHERLIDKYLASERWGEHRARYWLDAARYADTHGIHVDNYREMWPYRDWVIGAFNRNLPFDRFTVEQLAGDLLPNRTLDQQIASGFNRCNVTTNEAGVIVEEVEAIYAKDRVDTTGTVWLGLTVGCATCHDHKFDPISARDFYSLAAFFRNTTQNAMDGNVPDSPPVIVVPGRADRARWDQLAGEERDTHAAMAAARSKRSAEFEGWLPGAKPVAPLGDQVYALERPVKVGSASVDVPPVRIDADKPFSIAARFFFPRGEEGFVIATQSDPKDKGRGWHLEIGARVVNFRLVGDDGKQITMRAGHMEQLTPGTWNHVAVSYDGSREQAGLALFLNGKVPPSQGAGDQSTRLPGSVMVAEPLRLGRNLPGGEIADFRVFARAMSDEDAWIASRWPNADRETLHLYHLRNHDADYRALAAKLDAMALERRAIRRRGSVTHVMHERADSKPFANILYRGMYDQPRDRVEPNTPSVLPPMSASLPRNRLGLARWLVDPANPLTARVAVNRFWQEVFGTGLVRTVEDFGSQGAAPTHPELLDWLAVEFRESGWDVKRLFKTMLMSNTYRQGAATTPDKLDRDPDNALLSRGPKFRMDAEMVRDYALAASGLLSSRVGGPSVRPYQPDGIWEAVAMQGSNTRFYKRDDGDKLYRRSMYTFWKRSAPPASMEIFNAPTRETCTVRRERTNTPLQALATMNDPQLVEAARVMAQGALKSPDPYRSLAAAALARPFTATELAVVKRAHADFLKFYDSRPEDAARLLAIGESKPDVAADKPKLAAMTMVANQILNLDEVLSK